MGSKPAAAVKKPEATMLLLPALPTLLKCRMGLVAENAGGCSLQPFPLLLRLVGGPVQTHQNLDFKVQFHQRNRKKGALRFLNI
jgi:hypothetical protein